MENIIHITITRTASTDEGTFGRFDAPALNFSCLSLELPDHGNKPSISRVLPGKYSATWTHSPRKNREMYRLEDKHDRVGILIHSASFGGDKRLGYECDLEGCISLGSDTATVQLNNGKSQHIVTGSRDTVHKFEQLANGRPLMITIIDPPKKTKG